MSRLRALTELLRISNLPTVWSNVLVGLCAGYSAKMLDTGGEAADDVRDVSLLTNRWFLLAAGLLMVSTSSAYLGGMVLNDLVDQKVDAVERPSRPLPSGRVSPSAAWALMITLMFAALAALWPFHQTRALALGAMLVLCVVAYNVMHQRSGMSVLLLGLCRAMVVIVASSIYPVSGMAWAGAVLPFALALGTYTVLLSVVARREAEADPAIEMWRVMLAFGMIVVVLMPVVWFWPAGRTLWLAGVAALLVVAWLAGAGTMLLEGPGKTRQAVMAWLAGIALADVWYLTLLGRPLVAVIAGLCFILTTLGHRRIAGT